MDVKGTTQVISKIFVGVALPGDLLTELKQTKEWKQVSVFPKEENILELVRYKDRQYIGKYLEYSTSTLHEVQKNAETVKQRLKIYLPEIDFDTLKISLFSQVFVS